MHLKGYDLLAVLPVHVSFMRVSLQLVKKLMDRAKEPRTALMLPAIVYAHLVKLDMANVKGEVCT